jgi:C_GCAxxG_C_C family probable redox protein
MCIHKKYNMGNCQKYSGKKPSVQICRRRFFNKSLALTTGIALVPGILLSSSTKTEVSNKPKDDIFKQLDKLVDKYFPVFRTCSQTSFCALNEVFNLKSDNITKALAPFPGIAGRGETCGSVTGSLLAIALIYEDDNILNNNKKLSLDPAISFCTHFENEFGSTRCRDVLEHVTQKKYDISEPADYKIPEQEGAFKNCPGVIKQAIHYAAEIILEKS